MFKTDCDGKQIISNILIEVRKNKFNMIIIGLLLFIIIILSLIPIDNNIPRINVYKTDFIKHHTYHTMCLEKCFINIDPNEVYPNIILDKISIFKATLPPGYYISEISIFTTISFLNDTTITNLSVIVITVAKYK